MITPFEVEYLKFSLIPFILKKRRERLLLLVKADLYRGTGISVLLEGEFFLVFTLLFFC